MSQDKPLWQHQERAIYQASGKDEFALLFDPGCGKSRTFIEILRTKVQMEGRLLKTLILAPIITLHNWRDEFIKFTKVDLKHIVILEGSEKERMKKMAIHCFSHEPDRKILIMNYEGLLMEDLYDMILKWGPEVVCYDEMHKLKNAGSERNKLCRKISEQARYRFGLTGTAILNNLMDVFGQWLVLDNGKTFGKNFFVFRNSFFYDKNVGMPKNVHFPKWVIRKDSVDQIKSMMAASAITAEKEDVLKLPPLIKQEIKVHMTHEQQKHYKDLKKDFITYLNSTQQVTATTALTRTLRLMQLTSGYLKSTDGSEILLKKNPKADALKELLESIYPNKVVIWASFIKNYDMIRKVLNEVGYKFVECHGSIPNAKKFEAVELFNKDSNINAFIGHPESLGIGINLVAARYMIYFSRDFSLGHDIQSEARLHRAGSEIHESIVRYDIVMANSVDELCVKALNSKQELSMSVLKGWFKDELEMLRVRGEG